MRFLSAGARIVSSPCHAGRRALRCRHRHRLQLIVYAFIRAGRLNLAVVVKTSGLAPHGIGSSALDSVSANPALSLTKRVVKAYTPRSLITCESAIIDTDLPNIAIASCHKRPIHTIPPAVFGVNSVVGRLQCGGTVWNVSVRTLGATGGTFDPQFTTFCHISGHVHQRGLEKSIIFVRWSLVACYCCSLHPTQTTTQDQASGARTGCRSHHHQTRPAHPPLLEHHMPEWCKRESPRRTPCLHGNVAKHLLQDVQICKKISGIFFGKSK